MRLLLTFPPGNKTLLEVELKLTTEKGVNMEWSVISMGTELRDKNVPKCHGKRGGRTVP